VPVLVSAVIVAWLTQRDFGSVAVTNVRFDNLNGIPLRAKLLRPVKVLWAAVGILLALLERERTGRGQRVDAFLLEGGV
jgi:hypothetical protein